MKFRMTALTLVGTPLIVLSPAIAGEQNKAFRGVLACRQENVAIRLACYDEKVAALAAAETSGDVVITDRDQQRKARQATFGLSTVPAHTSGEKSSPIKIDAKIRSVRELGYGRWEFTLDNNMLWRQVDDEQIFPLLGQSVTVRSTPMGGYIMKLPSRAVRVARVR